MLSDGWMIVESSVGMTALSNIFGQKVNYRLHRIVVQMTPKSAVATVYDGLNSVFMAQGQTEKEALDRAKAWVDEQDESLPIYDLTTG
jgi:hypothetical protein